MYSSTKGITDAMLNKITDLVWELCAVKNVFVYLANEVENSRTLKIGTGIFCGFSMDSDFEGYIWEQPYKSKKKFVLDKCDLEKASPDNKTLSQIVYLTILPIIYEDKLLGLVGIALTKADKPVASKKISLLQQFIDLEGHIFGKTLEEYHLHQVIRNQEKVINRMMQTENIYSLMVYRSLDAIVLMHADGTFAEINPAFSLFTGFAQEEVIGKNLKDLGVLTNIKDWEKIIQMVSGTDKIHTIVIPLYKKNHQVMHAKLLVSTVTWQGKVFYMVVGRDISKQVAAEAIQLQQEDTIKRMAYYDALTGLPNKNNLNEWLTVQIARTKTDAVMGTVLLVDLDQLKMVNDVYGHAFGDKIIIAASRRLVEVMGAEAFIARIGGDKFAVILQGKYTEKQIEAFANKISRALRKKQEYSQMRIHSNASIGIANYPEDGDTVEKIIKNAEHAMSKVKKNRKKCWNFYNKAMQIEAHKKIRMIAGLEDAIELGELFVVYQPQIDFLQKRVGGVEALLRWKSHEYGNVSPVEFIPLAEQSGLINSIGEWVLNEACSFVNSLVQGGMVDVCVAVNISAKQVASEDFVEMISRVTKANDIQPKQIEIEITESLLMISIEDAISKLNQLKAMGFNLALDDFGTGYSSLTYLLKLPVGTLKLDKFFVDLIETDAHGAKMIGAIVNMAKLINMKIIAEGVETETQLDYLLKEGCACFQGYFFSKPLVEDEAYKFIQTYNKV